jgi:hypothetical protein
LQYDWSTQPESLVIVTGCSVTITFCQNGETIMVELIMVMYSGKKFPTSGFRAHTQTRASKHKRRYLLFVFRSE